MSNQKTINDINGLIVLDKKKDYTSNDCLSVIKKLLHPKKIGHTGTLDKNAEGVLVCLLGTATKSQEYLMKCGDKIYEAELILGIATDTEDITGNILATNDIKYNIDDITEKLEIAIKSFIGDYYQTPPMYSAKKVNGQKLLNLARKGKEVDRKANLVHINSIEICSVEPEKIVYTNEINIYKCVLKVCCSKGTYIRTLCKDIGENLGLPSCMGNLKRTKNGYFDIKDSITLDELKDKVNDGDFTFIKPCYFMKNEAAVAFGKFETLHIGHKKIIEVLINEAKSQDIESTVLIVGDDEDNEVLTKAGRISKLDYLKVDNILSFKLTEENKKIGAECFIEDILYRQLKAKIIVAGSDCRFGYKGMGDSELLKKVASKFGIKVVIIDKLKLDGQNEDISSTYILEQYRLGNIDEAKKYL